MENTFLPPLSGEILSVVVDTFDLRTWDGRKVFSQRNTTRYFSGERVGNEAAKLVHGAVADAIIGSGIVPRLTTVADLLRTSKHLPADLAEAISNIPANLVVSTTIERLSRSWDAIAGPLRSRAPDVAYPRVACGAVLRFVAIDAALRVAAAAWLTRHDGDELVPKFWMQRGLNEWLRTLVESCEPRTTRDSLAELIEVDASTLDGWLYADIRPTDVALRRLAKVFAARVRTHDDASMLRRLRLAYSLRALWNRIEAAVGPDFAEGLATRLIEYTMAAGYFPRASQRPPEENDEKARMTLMLGAFVDRGEVLPWVEAMLTALQRIEADPVWRTSLEAAKRPWLPFLQDVCSRLPKVSDEEWLRAIGRVPSFEERERLGYESLAPGRERWRDPSQRWVSAALEAEGGDVAAIEVLDRAVELRRRGDQLGAISLARRAIEHDPLQRDAHYRLGCWLGEIGDTVAALHELEICVEIDRAWPRPWAEMGIVLLNASRDEEARAKLLQGKKESRPVDAWLLFQLANSQERLGELVNAITSYEDAVALDPASGEALDRVAHLYIITGDRISGRDRAKRAKHLGYPSVYEALESGYYRGQVTSRPPQLAPPESVVISDLPRTLGRSR